MIFGLKSQPPSFKSLSWEKKDGYTPNHVFINKKMTSREEKRIRKNIVDLLEEKDNFRKADEILIDELVYHLSIIEAAKADIRTNGLMYNATRDPDKQPYFVINQAYSIEKESTKIVQSIFRQLAIAPVDRLKVKPVHNKDEDSLNNLNNFLNG